MGHQGASKCTEGQTLSDVIRTQVSPTATFTSGGVLMLLFCTTRYSGAGKLIISTEREGRTRPTIANRRQGTELENQSCPRFAVLQWLQFKKDLQ